MQSPSPSAHPLLPRPACTAFQRCLLLLGLDADGPLLLPLLLLLPCPGVRRGSGSR